MEDLEHFFRHQYGAVLAQLVRRLGSEHWDLAEESVQEALARAVRTWPLAGKPDDPAAWIFQTARHVAIDALRRSARFEELRTQIARPSSTRDALDDQLRMMFMCCTPALSTEDRVALTLNAVGGFGAGEIARAFFVSEATMAQRLVRAKRKLRESEFFMPSDDELPSRLDSVLDVLYLVFNEGYTFREGAEPLQADLVDEALRLLIALVDHPAGDAPQTHALVALALFQASRIGARQNPGGALVSLVEQDRRHWDERLIQRGLRHLEAAGRGDALSAYHLLAGIAACHATAKDYAATRWDKIVPLYDALLAINDTPVIRLNRAVAVSMRDGPAAGLELLEALRLESNYLWFAAKADCLCRLGRHARREFERAAELATNRPEREYLLRRAAAV